MKIRFFFSFTFYCWIFLVSLTLANIKKNSSEIDTATINYLRVNFYEAIDDKKLTYELISFIEQEFKSDVEKYVPIILAYRGALEALQAKHTYNPFSKVSYLVSSLNKIEQAVNNQPESLEIRFIRFSILHNLPGILGYRKELREDAEAIVSLLSLKDYSNLDSEIQQGIIEFMLESNRLSPVQEKIIKQLSSMAAVQ